MKIQSLLFIIPIFILLLLDLLWLSITILILTLICWSALGLIRLIKQPLLKKISKGSFLLLFVFFIAIGIKLLMLDVYKIPSLSMNNTLYTNDVIMVNKLKYGPKLPRSPFEIPWVNIAFYLNDKARATMGNQWWSYKRLSGTTTVKNGDVVVFTMPFGNDMTIVKRCMAIAGDTIAIKKGDVYLNYKIFTPSNHILNKYEFKVKDRKTFYHKLDSIDLDIAQKRTRVDHFMATLSLQDIKRMERLNIVQDLNKVTDSLTPNSTAYPKSEYNQWNFDDYGPYIIPKKGMRIDLDIENYTLYEKLINKFENIEIKNISGIFYINKERVTSYTFIQDYYFMMGDNRKGSMDSRVWGLVPEERIIGKVQCVLWSNYQDEFQWSRLLKSVD